MEYRRIGQSGLKVSKICLGCMSFGGAGGPTHPWAMDEEAARPFFRRAVEAGITFFDTANAYNHGASEEVTGRALKEFARRDEVVIASKVGLSMGEGPMQRGLSRKHIMDQIDGTLRRLGTDHVDLYYIHRLDPDTPFEETLVALDDVVRAGKVRYLGASSMWTWQFVKMREMQLANGLAAFVAMQNFYNLAYREEEREMIPYCISEGVGVVPWSPLARGFLAGGKKEVAPSKRSGEDNLRSKFFGSPGDFAVLKRVQAVAERLGISPAQVALAWVMGREGVSAPIFGATKIEQLDEAIKATEVELDARSVKSLETAYKPRAPMGHS
ncbi:MAG: aldo/keto reductase [Rhizobiaceae bacterium]